MSKAGERFRRQAAAGFFTTGRRTLPLGERIAEALRRLSDGLGPMRIPADECDADLVLTDCAEALKQRDVLIAAVREALKSHKGERFQHAREECDGCDDILTKALCDCGEQP